MRPADNPFRSECIDGLSYRIGQARWQAALGRFERAGWTGALVGPHGHGKSTALRCLRDHLESLGREVRRCRADREPRLGRLLRRSPRDVVFLLDGVERLGPLERHQVRKRARRYGGVVVTLHREGLLPTCLACRTTPQLLTELVKELAGDRAALVTAALPGMLERHRGNVRLCLFELYDCWPAVVERERKKGFNI